MNENMKETATRLDLIPAKEAAAFLCVPVETMKQWRLRGVGPRYVKYVKKCFYSRKELEAFVAGNTYGGSIPKEARHG